MSANLPDSLAERAMMLQNLLIARATGEGSDDGSYIQLRMEFMAGPETNALLPPFVRASRNLGMFWSWIKQEAATYEQRRQIIWKAMTPLLDYLEGRNRAPADATISSVLESFDEEGVHRAWSRALERRLSDPEGADHRGPNALGDRL
jgi:hypothetical protein